MEKQPFYLALLELDVKFDFEDRTDENRSNK